MDCPRFFLALRVRRLLWLFELLRRPEHHELVLAALLGHVPSQPSPFRADGSVDRSRAHPWLLQLENDVGALGEVDSLAGLLEDCTLENEQLNIVALFY